MSKNKKTNILFIILVCTFASLSSVGQSQLTLQQAIDYALENNLQLRRSKVNEQMSAQEVRRSQFDLYPDLYFGVNGQVNLGRSLDLTSYSYVTDMTFLSSQSLQSNLLVFAGRQKINEIKANKYLFEVDKSSTQVLKNELTLTVVDMYLKILTLANQLDFAKKQDTLLLKQLDVDTKNAEAGKKMLLDVSRTRFQISKNQLNITQTQNNLINLRLNFIQLLNLKPDSDPLLLDPKETPILERDINIEEIYQKALTFLPEIKRAENYRLAASKKVEVTKGALFPRITLSLNGASNYSRQLKHLNINYNDPFFEQFKTNLYQYANLNFNIPILTKMSSKISISQAKLKLEDAEISESIEKNQLYKIINKAIGDLVAAKKSYEYNQQASSSSELSFSILEKRYAAGSSSSLDLYQAQNEMYRSRLELIQSRYEVIFRNKVIDFYLGRPISY